MPAIVPALGAVPATAGGAQSPQSGLAQWLVRRLNEPTARELAHEHQGNVYVDDDLTDWDVGQSPSLEIVDTSI